MDILLRVTEVQVIAINFRTETWFRCQCNEGALQVQVVKETFIQDEAQREIINSFDEYLIRSDILNVRHSCNIVSV